MSERENESVWCVCVGCEEIIALIVVVAVVVIQAEGPPVQMEPVDLSTRTRGKHWTVCYFALLFILFILSAVHFESFVICGISTVCMCARAEMH